jgi:hypothetical protein
MSETGHVKNIEHLAMMISFCTGYGADYNPSNNDLLVVKLQNLYDDSAAAMDSLTTHMGPWKSAVTARRFGFKGLRPLATKVMNAFAVSGADEHAVEQAESFKRKIDGERAKQVKDDPDTPEDETANTISVSQQSYVQLVEHLDNLIQILTSDGHYTPNETDIQIGTLTTLSTTLKALNQSVINAFTPFDNARIVRDAVLYTNPNCLFERAADVKKYVKSVFGAESPQFAQVRGLEFRDVR